MSVFAGSHFSPKEHESDVKPWALIVLELDGSLGGAAKVEADVRASKLGLMKTVVVYGSHEALAVVIEGHIEDRAIIREERELVHTWFVEVRKSDTSSEVEAKVFLEDFSVRVPDESIIHVRESF